MDHKYKEPNKSKGEDGYKNNRGLDMIASFFGGMAGKTAKAKHERRERINSDMENIKDRD